MRKQVVKAWPEGIKLVVMVTVVQETWADGHVPVFSPMVMATPMKPGTPDLQGESWASYGGETGIWRIFEILEKMKVKSSLVVSGKSIERFPQAVRAFAAGGHEICGHAYTQDQVLPYMSAEEELTLIRRCTNIIADATGEKPKGWGSPRATQTAHTAEFLASEGYVWHGDYNDTDLPYVVNTGKGKLAALMHSDFSDIRVIRGNPRDYFTVHRDMFDFLYASGRPEIINVTLHSLWGGRPLMANMFAQILEYFQSFEGVWIARHDEVAQWVLDTE